MCAENESIEMDSVQLVLGPSALGLAGLSNAEPKKESLRNHIQFGLKI